MDNSALLTILSQLASEVDGQSDQEYDNTYSIALFPIEQEADDDPLLSGPIRDGSGEDIALCWLYEDGHLIVADEHGGTLAEGDMEGFPRDDVNIDFQLSITIAKQFGTYRRGSNFKFVGWRNDAVTKKGEAIEVLNFKRDKFQRGAKPVRKVVVPTKPKAKK